MPSSLLKHHLMLASRAITVSLLCLCSVQADNDSSQPSKVANIAQEQSDTPAAPIQSQEDSDTKTPSNLHNKEPVVDSSTNSYSLLLAVSGCKFPALRFAITYAFMTRKRAITVIPL